jgi:hypothetical protein
MSSISPNVIFCGRFTTGHGLGPTEGWHRHDRKSKRVFGEKTIGQVNGGSSATLPSSADHKPPRAAS